MSTLSRYYVSGGIFTREARRAEGALVLFQEVNPLVAVRFMALKRATAFARAAGGVGAEAKLDVAITAVRHNNAKHSNDRYNRRVREIAFKPVDILTLSFSYEFGGVPALFPILCFACVHHPDTSRYWTQGKTLTWALPTTQQGSNQ